jgi:hypothetical protein
MAAKKKAPTGLKSEQLEALQAIVNAKNENHGKLLNLVLALNNLEAQKAQAIKDIAANDLAMQKLQESFFNEYGDVNINVNTGEFIPAEE